MATKDAEEIRRLVRERYAARACKQATSCCRPAATCQPKRAEEFYTREVLEGLPEGASSFSLGCGNPPALAELKPGEVVLDLGSGGGIDCFLAAQKVGVEGRAIGLDMTPEMVQLARENAKKMGATNIEFRLGEIEHMPIQSNSVDAVISNCVINLSPDKGAVFREIFRVLKPGGRLCISDIVVKAELPPEVRENPENWSRCVSGALEKSAYLRKISDAGFIGVTVQKEEERPSRPGEEWRKNLASITVKAVKPE